MIPFNKPPYLGTEERYLVEALRNQKLCGDGPFTKQCHQWFETRWRIPKALLTTSCTHALEMAALLLDIQPGDEVIAPSYTFVSTVNAFALRGANIVFVDIRPDTLNLDETLVEAAVTPKTKAIVVVHYAGVSCEMSPLLSLANRLGIAVVEDAAQALGSTYQGAPLGTLGVLGCFSFHETKNITCGEGGLLVLNDARLSDRAEILREKGTDRSRFFRGMVDKYSWVDLGSSYLPSELNAAHLWAQLEGVETIQGWRHRVWNQYWSELSPLAETGAVELPTIPEPCEHNAHMFYVKVRDLDQRTKFIQFLKDSGVGSAFHYVPLHSAPFGLKVGRFHGEDRFTTRESERLVRLPLWFGLTNSEVSLVCDSVRAFFA